MKQDDVREKINQIMEKHTKYLTKTDGIVSFDTVVLDQYDATNDLVNLFRSHSTSLLQKMEQIIGEDDDEKILIAPMFKTMAKIRNQLRAEQRLRLIEAVKGK